MPVVRRVASAVAQSDVGDIVLVVGANGPEVVKAAGPGRWRAIENPNASDGLSSSLRLGLQSVDKTADGVLVALGDMPGITTELIKFAAHGICRKRRQRTRVSRSPPTAARGHPVIWPRALVPRRSKPYRAMPAAGPSSMTIASSGDRFLPQVPAPSPISTRAPISKRSARQTLSRRAASDCRTRCRAARLPK